MPRDGPKPQTIALLDKPFQTEDHEKAAKAILAWWDEEDRNMSAIARRSGYSSSHINNVYHAYFVPADEVNEAEYDIVEYSSNVDADDELDISADKTGDRQREKPDLPKPKIQKNQARMNQVGPLEAYQMGFRNGFRDGYDLAKERSE